MRVAGFDIGTNSVRVLITDVDNLGRVRPGLRIGFATRLGEGLSATCRIGAEPLERTCRVLGKSVRLARALGARRSIAGGTHAIRVADNSAEVVSKLEESAEMPVRVLSQEEEAIFAYTGAFSDEGETAVSDRAGSSNESVPSHKGALSEEPGGSGRAAPAGPEAETSLSQQTGERRLVIDVGGGSTTITQGRGPRVSSSITLPVGCVTLTEKFLRHDPATREELSILKEHVLAELKFVSLKPEPGDFVRGIGGAITSVAAVSLGVPEYVSRRIEGHILAKDEMERCAETLSGLGLEERERVAGLGRKRAEIAVAGAVLLVLLAEKLELPNIFVSTRGLRYGLALEAARGAARASAQA